MSYYDSSNTTGVIKDMDYLSTFKFFIVEKSSCFIVLVVFLAVTKQLYEWFSLSVCPSVRLSVTLFLLCSHHQYSDTFWLADRTRLFVQYNISLSSLCKLISRH